MNRRNICTWLLFYGLSALTTASLCVDTPDDAGLIVADGKPLSWPTPGSMPLFLIVDPLVEPYWLPLIDVGIVTWDEVAATEIIVSGGVADVLSWDASSLGILVKPGQPDSDPTTEYVYNAKGQLSGAVIYLPPDVHPSVRLRVVIHELGHALGLDHDRLPKSVMYYLATEGTFIITDHDKALIKSLYGKR